MSLCEIKTFGQTFRQLGFCPAPPSVFDHWARQAGTAKSWAATPARRNGHNRQNGAVADAAHLLVELLLRQRGQAGVEGLQEGLDSRVQVRRRVRRRLDDEDLRRCSSTADSQTTAHALNQRSSPDSPRGWVQ